MFAFLGRYLISLLAIPEGTLAADLFLPVPGYDTLARLQHSYWTTTNIERSKADRTKEKYQKRPDCKAFLPITTPTNTTTSQPLLKLP